MAIKGSCEVAADWLTHVRHVTPSPPIGRGALFCSLYTSAFACFHKQTTVGFWFFPYFPSRRSRRSLDPVGLPALFFILSDPCSRFRRGGRGGAFRSRKRGREKEIERERDAGKRRDERRLSASSSLSERSARGRRSDRAHLAASYLPESDAIPSPLTVAA